MSTSVLPDAAPVNAATASSITEPLSAGASDTNEALIAGLLGALGLVAVGGVAFMAARRRGRRAGGVDEGRFDTVAQPLVAGAAVNGPTEASRSEQAFATPVVPTSSFMANPSASMLAPHSSGTKTHGNGDPLPLPAQVPQTFEERDALLKELVSAQPDRANPFTSVRARARRAKLIMQSLGEDFQSRKPRIDLSEYTTRWPALRGWQPATA